MRRGRAEIPRAEPQQEAEPEAHALERERGLHQRAKWNGTDHVGGRHEERREHCGDVKVAEHESVQPVLPENQIDPVVDERPEAPLQLTALEVQRDQHRSIRTSMDVTAQGLLPSEQNVGQFSPDLLVLKRHRPTIFGGRWTR